MAVDIPVAANPSGIVQAFTEIRSAIARAWGEAADLLVVGKYMKITRGSLTSMSYITQVDHSFVPFQGWTTSAQLIRGDGFINRNEYAGNAFYAEGRQGVYA